MQALIAQASVNSGGDALNLNPKDGDRMWFDMGVSWLTKAGDITADLASKSFIRRNPLALWRFVSALCLSANIISFFLFFSFCQKVLTTNQHSREIDN